MKFKNCKKYIMALLAAATMNFSLNAMNSGNDLPVSKIDLETIKDIVAGYDNEIKKDGVTIKTKELSFDDFSNLFPGMDDKKKDFFDKYRIRKVLIKNGNSRKYTISIDTKIQNNFDLLNRSTKVELFCGRSSKFFTVMTVLVSALFLYTFVKVILNKDLIVTTIKDSFDQSEQDFGVTSKLAEQIVSYMMVGFGIIGTVPLTGVCLSNYGVNKCLKKFKNKRDKEITNFFNENVIESGVTEVDENSTMEKYLVTQRDDSKTYLSLKSEDENGLINECFTTFDLA